MKKYFNYEYFQKSYYFLYPLLGFKRLELFVPVETYLYCDQIDESIIDFKLIVLYRYEDKEMYMKWEKETILPNKYLYKVYFTDNGVVYVFDLSSFPNTVDHFLNGEYRKFSDKIKERIYRFHIIANNPKDPYPANPKGFLDGTIPWNGSIYPMTALYFDLFKDAIATEMHESIKLYSTLGEARDILSEMDEIAPVFDIQKETLITTIIP